MHADSRLLFKQGHRDSLLVRAPDSRSKGCEFESRQQRRENFLLVCWLLFGVRSISVLPQWHVKVPGHSAKSAGDWLHVKTHIPWTQRSRGGLTTPLFGHNVGRYPETSSHTTLSGNIRPQSSQLAEPLWTDPSIKSGISVRELIFKSKKKKKRRRPGMNGRTFSQNTHKRPL